MTSDSERHVFDIIKIDIKVFSVLLKKYLGGVHCPNLMGPLSVDYQFLQQWYFCKKSTADRLTLLWEVLCSDATTIYSEMKPLPWEPVWIHVLSIFSTRDSRVKVFPLNHGSNWCQTSRLVATSATSEITAWNTIPFFSLYSIFATEV